MEEDENMPKKIVFPQNWKRPYSTIFRCMLWKDRFPEVPTIRLVEFPYS